MILCTRPTRQKHAAEVALLANLRMAALVAGDKVSQSQRVQVRSAELLKHLVAAMPSPEFQEQYINRSGMLGEGLILHVDHNMSTVTLKRATANNVVSLHKITVSTVKGGAL